MGSSQSHEQEKEDLKNNILQHLNEIKLEKKNNQRNLQQQNNRCSQQQNHVYSQQNNGYPQQQNNRYPQRQNYEYPQKNNGYPQQNNGYPQQNNGYSQQNNGYSQQNNRYPQQQNNRYPQQQNNRYPQQQNNGYPQQQNNIYPQQQNNGYPQQQNNGYPQQQNNGHMHQNISSEWKQSQNELVQKQRLYKQQQLQKKREFQQRQLEKQSQQDIKQKWKNEQLLKKLRARSQQSKFKSDSRHDEFKNELSDLDDLGISARKILDLPKNFNAKQLKKSYYKLALKTHPDKGGNSILFKIITKSYLYLVEEMKKNVKSKSFMELKHEHKYDNPNGNYQNPDLSEKFNIKIFNKIYDENKLDLDSNDGYGKWMDESSERREDIDVPKVFSDKFNLNIFNSTFEDLKDQNDENLKIIKYENPKPMEISSKIKYKVLGGEKVKDFGSSLNINDTNKIGYCDYRKAHTSKLINSRKVKIKTYKNIKDLERSRQNTKMSKKQQDSYFEQLKLNKLKEKDRKMRLKYNDNAIEQHFHKMNRLMLNH